MKAVTSNVMMGRETSNRYYIHIAEYVKAYVPVLGIVPKL